MSRTDKDDPSWVSAEWWKPRHYCDEYVGRRAWSFRRMCNIPLKPVREHGGSRAGRVGSCHWVPIERRRVSDNPPRWYVDHVWSSRTRTQVRDQLRRARGEYRATGEVDVVPEVDQHRHGASWTWS